jgi:hypothetical protein
MTGMVLLICLIALRKATRRTAAAYESGGIDASVVAVTDAADDVVDDAVVVVCDRCRRCSLTIHFRSA